MSDTRYYKSWSREISEEVSPEEAKQLASYSRGWLRDDGSVERAERYDRGTLTIVDYYDAGTDEEIAPDHVATYPGVTRMVHRILGRVGDYEWISFVSTGGDGTLARRALVLSDRSGNEVMSIDWNSGGRMMHVTKYLFGGDGEMLYAFGYKLDGSVLHIRDFANEEYSSFDEVKHALPDPDFYETAFALPRSIAGTPIPLDTPPAWRKSP
jgi:hypothetical protein